MSKKSNPTIIGAFVVGAIILLATAVALFGGSEYFAKHEYYVAYFEEDTKGLRVGSNVLLNGVRIGYVSEIALLMDETTFATITRATLEILPDLFYVTDTGRIVGTGSQDIVGHDRLVHEAGLRAQVDTQSIVTGQLVVSLSLNPGTDAVMRGVDPPHPEIPTMPSDSEAFIAKVQKVARNIGENMDIEEISMRINGILKGLDELTNSEDLRGSLDGINRIINDEDTQQLTASLQSTLDKLNAAVTDAGELFRNADGQVETLAEDLQPAINGLTDVLIEAEQTLGYARSQLSGESVQMHELEATLVEVKSAARAISQFFDYLERNPEALLSGKNQ
jgi:paraquat-inducible protein B